MDATPGDEPAEVKRGAVSAGARCLARTDVHRETAEKTSGVHVRRFEFCATQCAALRAGAAVQLGCDHPHCPARRRAPVETLASLAADLHG